MFLGDAIKRNLFGDRNVIGQKLVLAGSPLTIVGVLKPKEQSGDYGGLDRDRFCIPASTYRSLFGDRWVHNFVFQAKDSNETSLVIDGIYRALGRRLRCDNKDREALNLWDTNDGDRVRDSIFGAVSLITGLAGGLTLLVGAGGVLGFLGVWRLAKGVALTSLVDVIGPKRYNAYHSFPLWKISWILSPTFPARPTRGPGTL